MIKMDTQFVQDYMMPSVDGQWEIYDMLNEFADTFETSDDTAMWYGLIVEEAIEWVNAYVDEGLTPNLLKEYCDILYVLEGYSRLFESNAGDIPETVDQKQFKTLMTLLWASANITLTTFTTEEVMEGFRRVHKSNMSKLTEDGKVLRREDGKVLKSDQYLPPDLSDLVKGTEYLLEVERILRGEDD